MTTTVTRLKELLFDAEAQRLDDLQTKLTHLAEFETVRHKEMTERVDQVFARAGTDDRLKQSVAVVLDGALREAEVTRHEQLSQAMAPLVVKTIKNELRNSQDEMVDALYPLTGKLVKEYVRAAMADLMADINRRLGGSTPSELETRAKSLGLSVAELVVAEAQELKVDELFLVRKGAGDLVAHWERDTDGAVIASSGPGLNPGSNRDALIAGYLSGITQFSEEAFDAKPGSLESIMIKGERVFIRSSPAYLLAARCSGRAPNAVEQVVDSAFLQAMTEYQQVLADAKPGDQSDTAVQAILPRVAADCERGFLKAREDLETRAQTIKPASSWRLKAIAACVLLPLFGFAAWFGWQAMETARVRGVAQRVLSSTAELEGYPVLVDVERGGGAMRVTGLMPTPGVRDRTLAALRADLPGTAITPRLGLIPTVAGAPDLTGDLTALRQSLATTRQQADQLAERVNEIAALRTQQSKAQTDITAAQTGVAAMQAAATRLQSEVSGLGARIDAIRIPPPAAAYAPGMREQLDTFTRFNAVFFANGTDFLDEAIASRTADQLIALALKTDALIRVVGYTDERGTAQANAGLAQARADRVASLLADRGLPRDRIVAVGRQQGLDLSRSIGVGSSNRRTVFEVGYIGEPVQR